MHSQAEQCGEAPNGAKFDSPGRSAAEPWVSRPKKRGSPGAAQFRAAVPSRTQGIAARWALSNFFIRHPGLRRLSRLCPGLSNFAPFGAFPLAWSCCKQSRRWLILAALLFGCLVALLKKEPAVAPAGQAQPGENTPDEATPPEPPPKELSAEEKAALAEGQALFRGLCSGCHGGLGRGGKGPDLTDDRWLHGNKDEDIARVIQNGVPGTTMKRLGESLKEEQIGRIIGYVRSLARSPGDNAWKPYMPGDPKAGEELFFDDKGKAPCAKCHTVNRKGGRVGPSLDRIASRRSPEFIMESIVQPSKFIDPLFEAVAVITREGQAIVGLRINETNFSIQMREENGRFHSLQKRDLEEFRVMDKSLMPENLAEQITVKQLHDLFAFLMTLE